MKKILLINPHETEQLGYSNPPLGLLYLAGTLIKHGFDVRLVDGCLDGRGAIARAIEEFRPSMVGITCLTPGRKKALEVAKMVKDNDTSTIVVFGGVHPTIMYRQMLENYSDIDFIVLGEGEIAFLELAQGKKHPEIDGLAYRDVTGIVKTHQREYIQNLDTISFPAWHLVDLKKYPARGDIIFRGIDLRTEPRISVIFSRGCKGHCDFCSTWWIWKGWRHRSATNMVDELELLHRDFNIKHFCFADDAMTVDRQATIDLCDEIMARNLHIAFHVTTRTDCVDELVLEKLKAAGCYQIAFGVETGSLLLLEKMGKENDIETAERAIQLSKKVGITTTALMIVGNVGEQAETVNQTISFLQRARPNDLGCVGGLWILPGTKLYQDCKRNGYIDDDFWLGDDPYKIYTLEWSLEDLSKMQQLIFNYSYIENETAPMAATEQMALASQYKAMYEERAITNRDALTLAFWEKHFATQVVSSSDVVQGKVLDLGCGTGEIDIWLARAKCNIEITAVDVCREALDIAKNYLSNEPADIKKRVYFEESLIERLPFDDETFDACFISHTLEHIRDHLSIFTELYRVLKKQSHVIVIVPFGHCHDDPTHVWHFQEDQLKEYLKRFGTNVNVWRSPDGQQLAAKITLFGKPRIICTLRIKNEEDWIIPTLEKASPLVAGFIILDDGSTDRTQELCKSFPKVLRYVYQNEPVKDEARDKDKLLNWALDEDPDWILALDGDELLEDAAPLVILHEIAICPQQVTALGFNFLYMWDDHDKYRVDNKYQNLRHPRLFKVKGLGIDPRKLRFTTTDHGANFHCGSVPANLPGEVVFIDVNVKHYGYFKKEQRERKKTFYEHLDPHNAAKGYYDHLTEETGLVLLPWRERTLNEVRLSDSEHVIKPADSTQTMHTFDQLPPYYAHVRPEILSAVPAEAINILDVGCGAGLLGKTLKEQNPSRRIVGIEYNQQAYFFARQNLDIAYNSDLETLAPPFTTGQFDCIIFADVLEHLKDPWEIAKQYATFLKPGGTLIASIPNIRRLSILKDLAQDGLWQYQDEGILDRTHLRFFTRKQFLELLRDANINTHSVNYLRGEDLSHLAPDSTGTVRYGNLALSNISPQEFAELCALQIMFVGTYQPANNLQAIQSKQAQYNFVTSIIIPVFNKVEYTKQCIHAIIRNTSAQLFEIIIIDNASTDDTKSYLQGLSGDVRIITNKQNVGYTIACNQGAAVAQGKYLVLLNNDTVPQPGWLESLISLAEERPDAGAIGAKLVYPNGMLQEAGGIVFQDGSGWNFGNGDDPNKPVYNVVSDVDYCSGACLLVKKELFDQVGGFDEQYAPAYYEETDLCFSLREKGYKTLYNPDTLVIHHESVTAGLDLKSSFRKYIEINKIKFSNKWCNDLKKHEVHPSISGVYPFTADRSRLYKQLEVPQLNSNLIGKKVILYFTQNPYPGKTGTHKRCLAIIDAFQQLGCQITFLSHAEYGPYSWDQESRQYFKEKNIEVILYHSSPTDLAFVAQSQLKNQDILNLEYHCPPGLAELFKKSYESLRPDVVFIFYAYSSGLLQALDTTECLTIVDSIDLVSLSSMLQQKLLPFLGTSPYDPLHTDPAVVREDFFQQFDLSPSKREFELYDLYDYTFTVSQHEAEIVAENTHRTKVVYLPITCSLPNTKNSYAGSPVFVAANNPFNIQAYLYLASRVMPLLAQIAPKLKVRVVGEVAQNLVKTDGIDLLGFVPDLSDLYATASCAVCPIIGGTGMSVKVVEAMAHGVPVVVLGNSTQESLIRHGIDGFIAQDAKEFACYVALLCQDKALSASMGAAARQFVLQSFSDRQLVQRLESVLRYMEKNGTCSPSRRIKVLYDISVLGISVKHHTARTGIFRVVEQIARGLAESPEIELAFCSTQALVMHAPRTENACRQYLAEHSEFDHVPFCGTSIPAADIFHSPFHGLPDEVNIPIRFLTVYDLIPVLFPQYVPDHSVQLQKRMLQQLRHNDRCLCISKATKADLCRYTNIPQDKATVSPLAADHTVFYPCRDIQQQLSIRQKYSIGNAPYFLSVCTLEPRKNIDHVLRVFARAVREDCVGDVRLVLTGTKGWDFERIFNEIDKNPALYSRIVLTGYVPDADLAALYSGALAFIYMSRYEGFGLPPLEAMQCGVPVITSNTSSLPEVVGDAGIMLDPDDQDGLCRAIQEIYQNRSLRQFMSLQSLKQANTFSWEKCVQETIKAYKAALNG